MYEVCIVWDNEFFTHTCATIDDAKEWATCYKPGIDCKVRIWRIK